MALLDGTIFICHMKDLAVGDRLVPWGPAGEGTRGSVTAVDAASKEVTVTMDDGKVSTFPWDRRRSRGYNKVKRLRRRGETSQFDDLYGDRIYDAEAPDVKAAA